MIMLRQDEELSLSVTNSLFLSLTHSFHVIFWYDARFFPSRVAPAVTSAP